MDYTFKTFKPQHPLISKYVDYYYLDVKPNNTKAEITCFPHYNTTISIYKSNVCLKKGVVKYKNNAKPLQIFTPIRDAILPVQQLGKVHRIVIVFKPLGVQQFYDNLNFTEFIYDFDFFSNKEISKLLNTYDIDVLTKSLDLYLLNKFKSYKNIVLEKALSIIFENTNLLSVQNIAAEIKISRRHLSRLFNTAFGISVKKFNEIVLFRKTLQKKLFKNTEQSFTDLAYEFNYCDQSHLNKTYKSFTLNSPNSFIKKGTHLGHEDTFWHLKK